MRIRLSDPALIPDLLDYLQASPDVVADVVNEDEVEVSVVGSLALESMRMELYLRIRAWEAARSERAGTVDLVDGP